MVKISLFFISFEFFIRNVIGYHCGYQNRVVLGVDLTSLDTGRCFHFEPLEALIVTMLLIGSCTFQSRVSFILFETSFCVSKLDSFILDQLNLLMTMLSFLSVYNIRILLTQY